MTTLTRREWLAASPLALTAAAYLRAGQKPNERVRLAMMGMRGRGTQLIPGFLAVPGVEIACLVDPDPATFARPLGLLKDHSPPRTEKDIRRVLEDPSITAIVNAAPDHWHALATVWAAQQGKHVYVEKPVSHNLIEGRRMVEAARRYKVVVQVGTQRRSSTAVQAARDYVRAGKLGKIPFVRTWIAGSRKPIGKKPDEPQPPPGVDYDLWLGPAPARPFNPNRFHYNWHWFWDYGTGELGNNGIHALDVVRAILDLDAPLRVSSTGGKYVFDDDQETPDTQTAVFEFPTCTVVWEHRVWEKNGPEGMPWGIVLHGEKGTLIFQREGWYIRDGEEMKVPAGPDMGRAHQKNFIDAIRGDAAPNADIEEGHKSTRLCHLGNIAYRLCQTLRFDPTTETTDSPAANQLLGREYRKGFELPKV